MLISCSDNKIVKDTEASLLEDTTTKTIEKTEVEEVVEEVEAVSLKEGTLLKKPERWSKTNSSVKNGKFYLGSKVIVLKEKKPKKRRYLKLRLNDGTEGWASDWLIVEDAKRAVVTTKHIRLYKKADIVAFSDEKITIGNKVALGNEVIGGFQKIVYKGKDKKPHSFWVKQKDTKYISVDENDYLLSEYFEKLQGITVEADKLELIDEVESNLDYVKSPFYEKIIELKTKKEEVALPVNLPLLDSVVLEDEF